jgi:cytochrome c556
MQNLFINMQIIKHGISIEDWELVAETAKLITDHPQPPFTEKLRILTFAGSNAGKLKDYDKKNQQAAQELRSVAAAQGGPAAVSAFTTLEKSCLACHESFRKAFKEHFYEQ